MPPPSSEPGAATAKGEVERIEPARAARAVARRVAESRATVPSASLVADVDAEAWVAAAERADASTADVALRACALALRELPRANASYRDGGFETYSRVNVGFAVWGDDGFVAPTIFDADRKSIAEIAREARALVARVHDGSITSPELSGGTFTVADLGAHGVRAFDAVVVPPQAGVLAVGAVEPRAVVRDGEVVARRCATLTLSSDQRILQGAGAARLLGRIGALLASADV